jgi:DUF2075 family protein
MDIELPTSSPTLEIQWNKDQTEWITTRDHVKYVGSVHKVLCVDIDLPGVILGPDFLVEDSVVVFDASKRPKKVSPDFNRARGEGYMGPLSIHEKSRIIRNQYFVLLSRGRDGLLTYSEDPKVMRHVQEIFNLVAEFTSNSQ